MTRQRWGWLYPLITLGMIASLMLPPGSPVSNKVLPPAQPKKFIALTFDDGPSPQYTPQILSLLSRYRAHATFFVLGSEVTQWPKLTASIAAQGSVLANHGWQHLNYFHVGLDRMWLDAQKTRALLARDHLKVAPFYRPPFGNSNKRLVDYFSAHGYTVTLWSIDTRDWAMPGAAFITRKVLNMAKPGSIVLMHDSGGNRDQTLQALSAILKVLSAEGYRFVTLPQWVHDEGLQSAPKKLPLPEPSTPPTSQ